MLDKMILGRYIQGDSFIHNLDPRTKLLATFYFILVVFFANNWLAYVFLVVTALLLVFLSQISLSFFLKGIRPMIWLILFTVCFQILFSTGGQVYFRWGPLG